jgi:spermidine/putrescine transport system permease protein
VAESAEDLALANADVRRPRRGRRSGQPQKVESGVWYPKWYWPSFAAPGILWLLTFFVLSFYVIFAVAFGTVDPLFRTPIPVYQPWWWSFETFSTTLQKFYVGSAIYQGPLLRTLMYVATATTICLVLGYSVAYYTARRAGKWKGVILILLVAPFWISYLMRIYAWQSLLQPDGYINDVLGVFGIDPILWLSGKSVTVILGLVYGYIPYMILPLYASLDRISQSLLEAGRDLGGNPLETFRRVTLPMSRQAILAGMVIVALPMFGDYYTNDLLGSDTTSTLGNAIDTAMGQSGQQPAAGSLAVILMVLVLIPMLYYMRETRRATVRT